MLASGFTIVRDMGNNANYADTALRQAIDQGWIPGSDDHQLRESSSAAWADSSSPTPEMAKDHNIVYPEYLDADTPDEIVKAIRQNILFGAKVIKICVDCKPYGYTADEIRLVIREAAKSGMKVEGHVQTERGAQKCDRGGHLVDRALGRAHRRIPQADGAEGHLPRRHRNAAGSRGPSGIARRPISARSPG